MVIFVDIQFCFVMVVYVVDIQIMGWNDGLISSKKGDRDLCI
jgi:hypothetical protein